MKANCILGHINSTLGSRLGEVIIPYYSSHTGLHLESCVHFVGLLYKKDDQVEQIQNPVEDHHDVQGLGIVTL